MSHLITGRNSARVVARPADFSLDEIESIRTRYQPNWDLVQESIKRFGYSFYRAGGSIFGLIPIVKIEGIEKDML